NQNGYNGGNKSEIAIRAIAELHRIEMSIFTLLKEFPEFNLQSSNSTKVLDLHGECTCSTTSMDNRTHSLCRRCLKYWCHCTYNQDWCPNPDCTNGIKGHHFKPYDEYYDWVQCPNPDCHRWFKKQEILAAHNCNSNSSSPIIEV